MPQWIKNGLVFIAPAASGRLFHADVFENSLVAFGAFCALASCIYLINDVRDIDDDRSHPTKRYRAIASGQLKVPVAVALAVALAVAAALAPLLLNRPEGLYVILAMYLGTSLAYTAGIKRVAVVEMAFVATGFFLRAYAGAAACHIPVSEWFLVVISFGALFLVMISSAPVAVALLPEALANPPGMEWGALLAREMVGPTTRQYGSSSMFLP
jgi:decaprenyl-phosphate phosphoribosyltransferase